MSYNGNNPDEDALIRSEACAVTRNPGTFLTSPSDSAGHRQKIESIEYTISTSMPGNISLNSLVQFGDQIVAAIEFLRRTDGQCKNSTAVILCLEDAKVFLQLAIDAARLAPRSNRQRYQNITLVGRKLREALKKW
jgi:hypothetical protein